MTSSPSSWKKFCVSDPIYCREREEKILALQIESNQTASKAFHALTDVDLDFGTVETPDGNKPLSQASFSSFLMNQNRELREKAYNQFYGVYEAHKNTLAALYGGSVHLDVYQAKVRNYPSAREAALFPDKGSGGTVRQSDLHRP